MTLTFEALRDAVFTQGFVESSLFLAGFVDIRSGYMSVNGEIFPKCPDCSGIPTHTLSIMCTRCGRNKRNNFQIRAGAGDGIYPVFEIKKDGSVIGTVTFFEPSGKLVGELFEAIDELSKTKQHPERLGIIGWEWFHAKYDELHCSSIGTLDLCWDVVREAIRNHRDEPICNSLFFSDSGDEPGPSKSFVSSTTDRATERQIYLVHHFDNAQPQLVIPSLVLILDSGTCRDLELDQRAESLDANTVAERWASSTGRNRIGGGTGLDIEANMSYLLAMILSDPDFWDENSWLDHNLELQSWHLIKDAFEEKLSSPAYYPNIAPFLAQLCTIRGNLELSSEFYDFDTKMPGPRFEKLYEWPEWLAEQEK
jgi:hypothetical protein